MTDTLKAKIDALNKEAWNVRVNDSNKSNKLSRQALDLAIANNYVKGEADASRTLGFTLIRISQHNEALVHLDNALEKFEFIDDLRGQSDVYEYYGIIRRSRGDYKSSLDALYKALELRKQTGYKDGESLSLYHLGVTYRYLGNLEQALEYFLQSLAVARLIDAWIPKSYSLNNIGSIYLELNDFENALSYFRESLEIRRRSEDKWGEAGCLDNIGYIYFKTNDFIKAINYCSQSLEISGSVGDKKGEGNALFHLAEVYSVLKKYAEAKMNAHRSLDIRKSIGDKKGEAELYLFLALLEPGKAEISEAGYLKNALALAEQTKAADLLQKTHQQCYNFYRQQENYQQSLIHLEAAHAFEREVHSNALNQKILNLEIKYKIEQSRQEAKAIRLRNESLIKLNEEIEQQKKELEKTLAELKSTQAQLIQSEKMASLGELTAGIAHEIQNPLNFVNNFSEINKEMIDELQTELKLGNIEEVLNISNDIKGNEEKINHHGKRADAIVKGMLQHSRQSSGKKEPADINALCDEYLQLSYHGLRTKDKSFNADFKTDFDEGIAKINIVPQDIGRVLLNLFNNAFYAVNERSQQSSVNGSQPRSYEYKPAVSLSTKKINDKVEITVSDNGNGIPSNIIDKIFQPFFTTKPTGQGTGLGLSLAYDIITKEHNGTIKVESKEGEGTIFSIQIPITA